MGRLECPILRARISARGPSGSVGMWPSDDVQMNKEEARHDIEEAADVWLRFLPRTGPHVDGVVVLR
jgi:hypothetical protein